MSYAMQLASKQEDVVCLELYVKEAVMPLMVLAIAARATHKELLRTSEGAVIPERNVLQGFCIPM